MGCDDHRRTIGLWDELGVLRRGYARSVDRFTIETHSHAELRTSSESWIASLLTQWTVHSEALLPALDLPKKSARPSDEGSADGRRRIANCQSPLANRMRHRHV